MEPFQAKLATHPIYLRVRTERGLQIFMTHHVFAVWDFMSLTKSLQRRLTSIEVPWLPPANPLAARLINEIVLGEETDEVGEGEYLSHYALYLKAMGEIGADPGPMQDFEAALRRGADPAAALAPLPIAEAVKSFVLSTLEVAQRSEHEVAAALLLAREDLIPVMFDRLVREMDRRGGLAGRVARRLGGGTADPRANFRLYLKRHVHLDGEEHGPMGRRMLMSLCGDDGDKWEAATNAARAALEARISLWDGVLVAIEDGVSSR